MKIIKTGILILVIAMLTACGVKRSVAGEYKQSGSNKSDAYQIATVTDDYIEIFWFNKDGNTTSLYWAGTFDTKNKNNIIVNSKNDTSKTKGAMLASSDEYKKIEYKNGAISYKMSIMGTTTTVKLEKTKN